MRLELALVVAVTSLSYGCYFVEDGSDVDLLGDEADGGESDTLTECEPDKPSFSAARSGQKCDFPETACGNGGVDFGSGRDIECHEGTLGVTNITVMRDDDPRDQMTWEDCSALEDGRHGEACVGIFRCFQEAGDGCLAAVICTENDEELLRVEYCDEPLPSASKNRPVVSGCAQAVDVLPNDPCEGVFLCSDGEEIETLEGAIGYGSTDEQHSVHYGWHLEWCDGEILHILSNAFFV